MVTLTTDIGEFQAETPEQAAREAKKASRLARKQEQEQAENRKQAEILAAAEGYNILRRYLETPDKAPRGWMFYQTGTTYGPNVRSDWENGKTYGTFDCEGGRAESWWYGQDILGHVWNGAGWTTVVAICDRQTREVALFSVAVFNGVCGFQSLPISLAWFQQSRENQE